MIEPLASNNTLEGGESAGTLAPGTVATIFGTNLSDTTASAPAGAQLPIDLGGVEVYFNGIRSPLMLVSPTQINTQIPWEVSSSNSVNMFIRTTHADGSITVTTAVGVPIALQNPGIFAQVGPDPRVALAYHNSSYATATITISGTIAAGDIGTITTGGRSYNYTVQSVDSLTSIRDALIAIIQADPDRIVNASPGAAFTRILLQARIAGPEGDGLPLSASSVGANSGAASLSLDINNSMLCCSSVAGAPISAVESGASGGAVLYLRHGLGLDLGHQRKSDRPHRRPAVSGTGPE